MPIKEQEIKDRNNIMRLYHQGMTVRQVADLTGATKGHVRRVLNS